MRQGLARSLGSDSSGAVCNWVCWCVAGAVNDFLFFLLFFFLSINMNLVKAGFGSCHMKSSMWVEAVVGAVISQRQLFRQPIPSLAALADSPAPFGSPSFSLMSCTHTLALSHTHTHTYTHFMLSHSRNFPLSSRRTLQPAALSTALYG